MFLHTSRYVTSKSSVQSNISPIFFKQGILKLSSIQQHCRYTDKWQSSIYLITIQLYQRKIKFKQAQLHYTRKKHFVQIRHTSYTQPRLTSNQAQYLVCNLFQGTNKSTTYWSIIPPEISVSKRHLNKGYFRDLYKTGSQSFCCSCFILLLMGVLNQNTLLYF